MSLEDKKETPGISYKQKYSDLSFKIRWSKLSCCSSEVCSQVYSSCFCLLRIQSKEPGFCGGIVCWNVKIIAIVFQDEEFKNIKGKAVETLTEVKVWTGIVDTSHVC